MDQQISANTRYDGRGFRQQRTMTVALIAPSPVPFALGGAENLWSGWLHAMNKTAHIQAELIKLPSPEAGFWPIVRSYRQFAELDLSHFDRVVSTKYPAWMVAHRDHHVFMQHKLRGLYDTWPAALDVKIPAVENGTLQRLRRLLASARGARTALAEIFGVLDELQREAPDLPAELFTLPGALIRQLVHTLDDIGLSRHAIRRYAAISQTVASRSDYFPATLELDGERRSEVDIIHHPTITRSAVQSNRLLPQAALFSASRLDAPKRMDWLIAAHARSGIDAPLYIAGDGPQREALEAQAATAGSAAKVTLMGRLRDDELQAAYEQASFVAYVPDREDYGLITLEALQAGRPVLTCTDSGGVTELINDNHNGLVTEASIPALADGMRRLATDTALRERLAGNARASVAHISWPTLVARFTQSSPRIAVINTFSFYPPRSGGSLRMHAIYSELGRRADIRCINLVHADGPQRDRVLGPGLSETRVPMSDTHKRYLAALEARLDASCFDVAALLKPELTPQWVKAVNDAASWADLLIFSHPYGFSALRGHEELPCVYEAHNVEADLKASILGTRAPELEQVIALERACAQRAQRVLACSTEDAQRLESLYQLPSTPSVVPNGVDARSYPTLTEAERAEAKARLALGDRAVALFIGSLHGPNLDAAQHIIALAVAAPDWQFAILGSVCEAQVLNQARAADILPANVHLIGRVEPDELRVWLSAADVGLNPITSGSGTNLKLLEYAAAGLAILSTPFGGRGGLLKPNVHFYSADIDDFPQALAALHPALALTSAAGTDTDKQLKTQRIEAARRQAREAGDWRRIAAGMWEDLRPLLNDTHV